MELLGVADIADFFRSDLPNIRFLLFFDSHSLFHTGVPEFPFSILS